MEKVTIKSKKEIVTLKEAGKILALVMDEIIKNVKPGVNTLDLDKLAEKLVLNHGGKPSFKGYGSKNNPFPATICASVNNEVVHGIPSESRVLKEGDIFKVDMGMEYQGIFVDMARTIPVGEIDEKTQKLLDVTKKALNLGIKELKAGSKMSNFSKVVQKYVESSGFSVVRDLVGHGVGYAVHEAPQVPNYYNKKYQDLILKSGMVLALEPMVNMGHFDIYIADDGWTYETSDGSLSAHFEDTVVITEKDPLIVTR